MTMYAMVMSPQAAFAINNPKFLWFFQTPDTNYSKKIFFIKITSKLFKQCMYNRLVGGHALAQVGLDSTVGT